MPLKAYGKFLLLLGFCAPVLAHAELGIYAKAGTLGYGGGIGYGISDNVSARLGYTALDFDHDIDQTDISYKGKFQFGGTEALLDWHPFSGSFRFTGGLIFSRNKIDVDANLNESTVIINGSEYPSAAVGSLNGTVKFKSTVPYLGIGWGNVAGKNSSFHFVADIGVEFQGSPDVKLHGGCTDAYRQSNSAECGQLDSDIQAEEKDLNDQLSDFKWWPVLSLGVAYRF